MNYQATIQAAIAGALALGFAAASVAQAPAGDAEGGPGKVLRRREGGPERLRHREARVRGSGRQDRQGPDGVEVREQGRMRQDGRQDGSAEGLSADTRDIAAGPAIRPAAPSRRADGALPAAAGIGLRSPHVRHVRSERPRVPWLEVHSENYFADGGPAIAALEDLRADYPISLHGVGMSLGSADPLDRAHVAKLERLTDRIEPALVSEHLCWSGVGGRHFNDLLPLPYTEEALAHVSARVEAMQEPSDASSRSRTSRRISRLPTRRFPSGSSSPSSRAAAGCDLLLDVNNIHVNSVNHGFDAERYLAAIPPRIRRRDPSGGLRRVRCPC